MGVSSGKAISLVSLMSTLFSLNSLFFQKQLGLLCTVTSVDLKVLFSLGLRPASCQAPSTHEAGWLDGQRVGQGVVPEFLK